MSSPLRQDDLYRKTSILYSSCMGLFSKAKDLYSLQKQTKSVKKELKQTHVEAEVDGVTVIINGEQEVVSVGIDETKWCQYKQIEFGKKKLEEAFLKSSNKAAKKVQEIAGAKMKDVWKQLGITQ